MGTELFENNPVPKKKLEVVVERKEKKRDVKSRIVSAAWQLFYERGYNGTTVDDIIALSGTSKGSFYYYFSSKDELLNTLADVLDDHYAELEEKMDPKMDCYDKLLFINYEMHCMMEEKIDIELLASLYASQLMTTGGSSLLNQNRRYYKLVTKIIEDGQKSGQIRADIPVSMITRYYSMCERALVSDWCMSKGAYSLGEYSKECMPMMMQGFRL